MPRPSRWFQDHPWDPRVGSLESQGMDSLGIWASRSRSQSLIQIPDPGSQSDWIQTLDSDLDPSICI